MNDTECNPCSGEAAEAASGEAAQRSPIEEESYRLREQLDTLHSVINELESRLQGVMEVASKVEDAESMDHMAEDTASPFRNELRSRYVGVVEASTRIVKILQRLEI